jgi:hypothetical protein
MKNTNTIIETGLNKAFILSDESLKSYLLSEFPELKRYELEYTGIEIDITKPTEGIVEWAIERFIDSNDLDYDILFTPLVKKGCELLNINYTGPKSISNEEQQQLLKQLESLGLDSSKF